jgi:two-component system response regulator NreC
MSIRVCIVDDHALFRKGLRMLLSTDDSIELVGEGATAADALRIIAETTPDVAVLDLTLPGDSGLSIIPQIREQYPTVRILVLTMHDDVEYAKNVLAAGASSYMTKSAAETEVLSTVHAVYEGRMIVSLGSMASEPGRLLASHSPESNRVNAPHIPLLSEREREVIVLIAQGHTSAEIADKLFLSSKTIDTYRSRMMTKLKLKSRAELVRFANENGLVGQEPTTVI